MPRGRVLASGWRGAALVAVTYLHFLIFAQFAFLKRLAELGIIADHLKAVMGAMAMGGILLSLLAPRLIARYNAALLLRSGLAASATAAVLALLPLHFGTAVTVTVLIGAGLGLLTVTLVTHLPQWTGDRHPLMAVGMGTGLAYLACNFPALFTATPEIQALVAGGACLAALAIPLGAAPALVVGSPVATLPADRSTRQPFPHLLAAFTALVWLDLAAFFIIQNNPQLKAGTWQGPSHLWTDGTIHLAAAVASAWFLGRRGTFPVLAAAFAALAAACLFLHDSSQALAMSLLYPAGVSLYSVALVA